MIMDFEVRVLSNHSNVKNILKLACNYYQEDFLLDDIIFISIGDTSKLDAVMPFIEIIKEQHAFH